jgi:hypothetical protein
MNLLRLAPGVLLLTAVCGFAASHGGQYQVELNEGGHKVKGTVTLTNDELRFVEGKYGEKAGFTILRRDIQKVRDMEGQLTFDLANPFTYRAGTRTQLTFKTDPKQSNKIMTWAGQPDVTLSEADRAAGIERWQDVSMTVEHRHATKDNCRGNLISGPDGLRYESSTMPEHSRTWNYSNVEKFERNAKSNEVSVKSRDGDQYVLTGMRAGSDASIFDIISKRMTSMPR